MNWLEQKIKSNRTPHNIVANKSDKIIWESSRDGSEEIAEVNTKGEALLASWPALFQDVFNIFYKPEPELAPEETVDDAHLVNRRFAEMILNEEATQEVRAYTMLEEISAAVAALGAGKRLVEIIETDEQLKQEAQKFNDAMKNDPGSDGGLSPGGQQALQSLQKMLDAKGQGLQQAVRRALRKAAADAKDSEETAMGWGLNSGTRTQTPIGDRIKMAAMMQTPRFKRMAELIGRLRGLAVAKQSTKIRHEADEIHSIKQGKDLQWMLPSEFVTLAIPEIEDLFYQRFLEGQLFQYELKPQSKKKRGPIIAMIDASGSMSGDRMEWAAACGLALLEIAKRRKRDFAVCYFRGQHDPDEIAKESYYFPKGDGPADQIIKFATTDADGGTDYEGPLKWACHVQKTALPEADIIMITDGQCAVSDEFLAEFAALKAERKLRVFAMLIGFEDESDELGRWADKTLAFSPDFQGGGEADQQAAEMFAEI